MKVFQPLSAALAVTASVTSTGIGTLIKSIGIGIPVASPVPTTLQSQIVKVRGPNLAAEPAPAKSIGSKASFCNTQEKG